jgi:hypothetical protein
VWYPEQPGPPCQYGLSKAYGFGPTEHSIAEQDLHGILEQAVAGGCDKLILSSEYFSLFNPKAVDRLLNDFSRHGLQPEAVFYSRDIFAWLRSLYNQLIRMSDGKDIPPNIDRFVERTLDNRAIDVARRYAQWADRLAPNKLRHYRLSEVAHENNLLAPFEVFAGCIIPDAGQDAANMSLDPERLFDIYKNWRETARDEALNDGTEGQPGRQTKINAPSNFLTIGYEIRARVVSEISKPYYKLPRRPLPQRSSCPQATLSPVASLDRAAATSSRHKISGWSATDSGIR